MIDPRNVGLPTTVRELAGYLAREFPRFNGAYVREYEQLLVVGPPEGLEPPAVLRELLASTGFAVQGKRVTNRGQWVTIVNATTTVDVDEVVARE